MPLRIFRNLVVGVAGLALLIFTVTISQAAFNGSLASAGGSAAISTATSTMTETATETAEPSATATQTAVPSATGTVAPTATETPAPTIAVSPNVPTKCGEDDEQETGSVEPNEIDEQIQPCTQPTKVSDDNEEEVNKCTLTLPPGQPVVAGGEQDDQGENCTAVGTAEPTRAAHKQEGEHQNSSNGHPSSQGDEDNQGNNNQSGGQGDGGGD